MTRLATPNLQDEVSMKRKPPTSETASITIDPNLIIENDKAVCKINTRLEELYAMKEVVVQKLDAVRTVDEYTGEVRYTEAANYVTAAANALMSGHTVSKLYVSAPDLERELAAVELAITTLSKSVQNQRMCAARRIREQLVPMRQRIVDDLIRGARVLRQALRAERAFCDELQRRDLERWASPLDFGVLRIGPCLPDQVFQQLSVFLGDEPDIGPFVGC